MLGVMVFVPVDTEKAANSLIKTTVEMGYTRK